MKHALVTVLGLRELGQRHWREGAPFLGRPGVIPNLKTCSGIVSRQNKNVDLQRPGSLEVCRILALIPRSRTESRRALQSVEFRLRRDQPENEHVGVARRFAFRISSVFKTSVSRKLAVFRRGDKRQHCPARVTGPHVARGAPQRVRLRPLVVKSRLRRAQCSLLIIYTSLSASEFATHCPGSPPGHLATSVLGSVWSRFYGGSLREVSRSPGGHIKGSGPGTLNAAPTVCKSNPRKSR